MKLIRRPNGGEKWTKEFTCESCSAVWEVAETDLKVYNYAVFYAGETWEPEIVFKCQDCRTENKVTMKIPSGMRDELLEKALRRQRS